MSKNRLLSFFLSLIMLINLIPSSTIIAYATDEASFPMQLATGNDGDSVLANYDQANKLITISGTGTITEANWIKLAHTIEGGTTSYTNNYGWKIPEDINMVFETDSTIQLSESGFKNKIYGWFQDFKGTIEFNNSLDTSNLTDMSYMFQNASKFDADISNWDTTTVTNMRNMFRGASEFNANISGWKTGNVTDMSLMFYGASSFNPTSLNWDVTNVKNMRNMFRDASLFSANLSKWNTTNVTTMSQMFRGASKFNSNLSNWDTGSVKDMSYMFCDASNFNADLSNWNTASVTYMQSMFYGASSFNPTSLNWDVSKVKNMSQMFRGASLFNANLSNWNTGSVQNMSYMFCDASNFNANLSNWNTANVKTMQSMFYGASSFNPPSLNWDVSKVKNMRNMFRDASLFSADLSNWNTANVTSMQSMFYGANSIENINLSNRNTTNLAKANNLLTGTNPNRIIFDKLQTFFWQSPNSYRIIKDQEAPSFITANKTVTFEAGHKYQLQKVDFPMELATGKEINGSLDSVLANYDKNSKLITISGNGTILKDKWIKLARKIEGGTTSYTKKHDSIENIEKEYGWHINNDIDMVFVAGSNIKLEIEAFNSPERHGYGWFQDFKGSIKFNHTLDTSDMKYMSFMFCVLKTLMMILVIGILLMLYS